MELRQYWNVIWRRRWLVLAILVLSAIVSGFLFLTAAKSYRVELRFITRQQPTPDIAGSPGITVTQGSGIFTFNRYYNWFASEFLVDDYTEIVTSDAFARSVFDRLNQDFAQGTILQAGDGTGGPDRLVVADLGKLRSDVARLNYLDISKGKWIDSDRKQRELRLIVTAPTKDLAAAFAFAASQTLTENLLKPLLGTLVNDEPAFSEIDGVTLDTIQSNTSRDLINAVVRVLIGLVAALALAFLLEYLDNSVRDERDARRVLDVPVIGVIPRS